MKIREEWKNGKKKQTLVLQTDITYKMKHIEILHLVFPFHPASHSSFLHYVSLAVVHFPSPFNLPSVECKKEKKAGTEA